MNFGAGGVHGEDPDGSKLMAEWDRRVTIDVDRSWTSSDMLCFKFGPYPCLGDLGNLYFTYHADSSRFVYQGESLRLSSVDGKVAVDNQSIRRKIPSEISLSDVNVSLVLGWLRECVREHSRCRPSFPIRWPTRLIDVGSPNSLQDPYLVVTSNTDTAIDRYAALSHCWGTPQAPYSGMYFATVKQNIEQFIDGVGIVLLPKTFQDAITVTRKLKIRYLWIDALCIIQDDEEDWAREAVEMNSVYGNAYVTIVATSSNSDHEGVFTTVTACN